MVCLLIKLDVHDAREAENPKVGKFDGKPPCRTRSKALEMSGEGMGVSLGC